jgi:hypothetical protein
LSQQREADALRRANESAEDRQHRLSQHRQANARSTRARPTTHNMAVNELAHLVEPNISEY